MSQVFAHPVDVSGRGWALNPSAVGYSRVAEWYLTGCFAFLLIDAVFQGFIASYAGSDRYLIYRVTGYAIMPTEVYFLSIGMLIGLAIFLAGRGGLGRAPTLGLWGFVAYWGIHLIGAVIGWRRGNPFWYVDFRMLALTSIVAPWVAVLGQSVRLDVVCIRVIRIALPLAIINAARGYQFIVAGAHWTSRLREDRLALGLQITGDHALTLVYCLALSRCLARGGRGLWSVLILAAGVVLPLNKPCVAGFVIATILAVLICGRASITNRLVSLKRSTLSVMAVALVVLIIAAAVLSLGGGAGADFLQKRFFKSHVDISKRDLSTGRIAAWRYGLNRWKSSPVVGQGLGTRVPSGSGLRRPWMVYHNQWLKLLIETGIVGFGIVTGAFVLWLRRAYRALKLESRMERFWPRIAFVAFVCTMGLNSMVGEPLESYTLGYVFWFVIALEAAAHTQVLRGTGRVHFPGSAHRFGYPSSYDQQL